MQYKHQEAVCSPLSVHFEDAFPCLNTSSSSLQYVPQKVYQIFLACCNLHNIAINLKILVELPKNK